MAPLYKVLTSVSCTIYLLKCEDNECLDAAVLFIFQKLSVVSEYSLNLKHPLMSTLITERSLILSV